MSSIFNKQGVEELLQKGLYTVNEKLRGEDIPALHRPENRGLDKNKDGRGNL